MTIGFPPEKPFHKMYSLGKEICGGRAPVKRFLQSSWPDFYNIGDGIQ
jgi:hypothetical protein